MNYALEELKTQTKTNCMAEMKTLREELANVDSTDFHVFYGDPISRSWVACSSKSAFHPSPNEYAAAVREFERSHLQQRLEEIEGEYRSIDGGTVFVQPQSSEFEEAKAA